MTTAEVLDVGRPVCLTGPELTLAAVAGVLRSVAAIERGRRPSHGMRESDARWEADITGALAEWAFAKFLDVFPGCVLRPDDGDTRIGVEVRGTQYPRGHLLIHEGDRDEAPYVLVTGRPPRFMVRGWVYGREGKHESFWRTVGTRAGYWVPIEALRPIDTLRPLLEIPI